METYICYSYESCPKRFINFFCCKQNVFVSSCRVTIIRVHGFRLRVLTAVIPPRSREKIVEIHLKEECPSASVTCSFRDAGCKYVVSPAIFCLTIASSETYIFCWLQSKPSSCNFQTLNKELQGYLYKLRCTVNTFWNYLCGSRLEIFPTNLPETIVENLLTWESASLLNC